jgi:hypothetical protein
MLASAWLVSLGEPVNTVSITLHDAIFNHISTYGSRIFVKSGDYFVELFFRILGPSSKFTGNSIQDCKPLRTLCRDAYQGSILTKELLNLLVHESNYKLLLKEKKEGKFVS